MRWSICSTALSMHASAPHEAQVNERLTTKDTKSTKGRGYSRKGRK
jgi:hypothetical protein